MIGEFLHCFCRNCGVPLWVECDGTLDDPPLDVQFREASGPGTTSIGVNVRAISDINSASVGNLRIERYKVGEDKTACVLDLIVRNEIISEGCAETNVE